MPKMPETFPTDLLPNHRALDLNCHTEQLHPRCRASCVSLLSFSRQRCVIPPGHSLLLWICIVPLQQGSHLTWAMPRTAPTLSTFTQRDLDRLGALLVQPSTGHTSPFSAILNHCREEGLSVVFLFCQLNHVQEAPLATPIRSSQQTYFMTKLHCVYIGQFKPF